MLRGFLDSGRFEVSGYFAEIYSDAEETLVYNLPSFKQKSSCDVLVASFPDPRLMDDQRYRVIMRDLRPAISLVEIPASLHILPNPPGSCFGYSHEWYVLDAADYLVPQHRKRCWVVSIDKELVGPNFKIGSPAPRSHPPTVREAIGDLPLNPIMQKWNAEEEHSGLRMHLGLPRLKAVERYDAIPPGSSFDAIPKALRPKNKQEDIGPSDIYGRLMWDYPASEIPAFLDPSRGRIIHPEWIDFNHPENQNRRITALEAARLQTFPDWYKWYGSRDSVVKQIGQATPPAQAMCWAHYLADLLDTDQ